jgi:transcriptional regulator with XRE-family HTH domain
MDLDKTLKKLIRQRGTTTSALAKEIDVPAKTISDWLSGRSPRDLDGVKRCAEALGVSVHYLLYGEEDQRNILDQILEKTEVHTGMYEVTIRKVTSKNE